MTIEQKKELEAPTKENLTLSFFFCFVSFLF